MPDYNKPYYCSLADYERNEADRLPEAELTVTGLYTVFFKLIEPQRPVAVRSPARLLSVDTDLGPETQLSMQILNEDLQPYANRGILVANLCDRFFNFDGLPRPDAHKEKIETGYLKSYEDPIGDELQLYDMLEQTTPLVVS